MAILQGGNRADLLTRQLSHDQLSTESNVFATNQGVTGFLQLPRLEQTFEVSVSSSATCGWEATLTVGGRIVLREAPTIGLSPSPAPRSNIAQDNAALVVDLLRGDSELRERARVVRDGSAVAIIFGGGQRYGALECDSDGDIVAMTTDRTADTDPEAWVATGSVEEAIARIKEFISRN